MVLFPRLDNKIIAQNVYMVRNSALMFSCMTEYDCRISPHPHMHLARMARTGISVCVKRLVVRKSRKTGGPVQQKSYVASWRHLSMG